jgi:molybdenum cofactor synthesis domain-containing protein
VRSACLLVVGDEILSGEIRDENGPWMLRRLNEAGVRVARVAVCPDLEDEVVAEVRRLRALADGLLVSGGIGPTHDDVTRQALARALGVDLAMHPDAERAIRGYFGAGATESDLEMGRLPAGCSVVRGATTGALGFALAGVYAFPGVPVLLRDLVEAILPDFQGAPRQAVEVVTQQREGEIAPLLTATQGAHPELAIGSYPVLEGGRWHVRIVLRGDERAHVEQVAARLARDLAALRPPGPPVPAPRAS